MQEHTPVSCTGLAELPDDGVDGLDEPDVADDPVLPPEVPELAGGNEEPLLVPDEPETAELSLDEVPLDEVSLEESLDELLLDEPSLDEVSLEELSLEEVSLDDDEL